MDPETNQRQGLSRRQVLINGSMTAVGLTAASIMPSRGESTMPPSSPTASASTKTSDVMDIHLQINGKDYPVQIEPRVSLLDTLGEHIGLTGTKKGCDHGQCGACTVLIDGQRVLSCLSLAVMEQGKPIVTVEGLAHGETLHPVQQAFIDHDAFQCGYCTPGQICSAVGLLHEGRAKTDQEIRVEMSGNICRCGAYPNIVEAVKQAMGHKA